MKRRFLRALVVLTALIVTWLLGGGLYARHQERRAERDWSTAFSPFEELPARFQSAGSATANELTTLAARMGIDLAPARRRAPRPPRNARRATEDVATRMGRFLAESAPAERPPAELSDFIVRNRGVLDAIEGMLATSDPVVWECDPEQLYDAPVPPLLGLRLLQNVLLFDALQESRAGRREASSVALEASYRLNDSLRYRPELVSQMVAVGIAQQELHALRRLDDVPEAWKARIREHDYRASWMQSLHSEAWFMTESVRRGRALLSNSLVREDKKNRSKPDPDADLTRQLVRGWVTRSAKRVARTEAFRGAEGIFEAPYLRAATSDTSARLLRTLVELRDVQPCPSSWERFWDEAGEDVPWWNTSGRELLPFLGKTGEASLTHALSVELTEKVLEAREAKRASGNGRWRAELPPTPSRVCADLAWVYEVSPEGGVSVKPERPTGALKGELTFRLR